MLKKGLVLFSVVNYIDSVHVAAYCFPVCKGNI
jgi:hypothetical protein